MPLIRPAHHELQCGAQPTVSSPNGVTATTPSRIVAKDHQRPSTGWMLKAVAERKLARWLVEGLSRTGLPVRCSKPSVLSQNSAREFSLPGAAGTAWIDYGHSGPSPESRAR